MIYGVCGIGEGVFEQMLGCNLDRHFYLQGHSYFDWIIKCRMSYPKTWEDWETAGVEE